MKFWMPLLVAAAIAGAFWAGIGSSSGPSPPTPRVARLQRQVATLQTQVSQLTQELQASHDAFDQVDERLHALEHAVFGTP